MSNVKRTTTQSRDEQVIEGIGKHLQNVSSLPLAGTTYSPADFAKLVGSRVDAAHDTVAAKATWQSTVAKYHAVNTDLTPRVRALRQYVINAFGEASPVLADFGFTPPRHPTRTMEEKLAAATKAKATRAARHTMGSVQKKRIKGAVVGIVVTPITAAPPDATTTPNGPTAPVQGTGATAGSKPRTA